VLTWAISVALVVAAPALKPVRQPAPQLVGDWAVVRMEDNGQPLVEKPEHGFVIRLSATTQSCFLHGIPFGAAEPADFFRTGDAGHVDLHPRDPKNFRQGIWKLDGNTLTICYADPGRPRPTEFTASAQSKRWLLVLTRKAKE
jgi:hypothetical protein